jgi:hypothetical protein
MDPPLQTTDPLNKEGHVVVKYVMHCLLHRGGGWGEAAVVHRKPEALLLLIWAMLGGHETLKKQGWKHVA